ncbi:MAG: hypothetical protein K1X87_09510, partial [Dehalococcoidia bacterium]|nr:hypothetical protein [Dehalococcoidia bacterium]
QPGQATQPGGGAGFGPGGPGGNNAVMSVVRQACTPVTDSTLPARYQGAMYDCQGKADAIRSLAAASTPSATTTR